MNTADLLAMLRNKYTVTTSSENEIINNKIKIAKEYVDNFNEKLADMRSNYVEKILLQPILKAMAKETKELMEEICFIQISLSYRKLMINSAEMTLPSYWRKHL